LALSLFQVEVIYAPESIAVKLALPIILLAVTLTARNLAQDVPMPRTIIRHVTLKWKGDVPDTEKLRVFEDLKAILADTPGVKGLWTKTKRIQPSDFSQTFVIEFADRDSYDAYVKHPKKKAWDKHYYGIREQSFNCITVN